MRRFAVGLCSLFVFVSPRYYLGLAMLLHGSVWVMSALGGFSRAVFQVWAWDLAGGFLAPLATVCGSFVALPSLGPEVPLSLAFLHRDGVFSRQGLWLDCRGLSLKGGAGESGGRLSLWFFFFGELLYFYWLLFVLEHFLPWGSPEYEGCWLCTRIREDLWMIFVSLLGHFLFVSLLRAFHIEIFNSENYVTTKHVGHNGLFIPNVLHYFCCHRLLNCAVISHCFTVLTFMYIMYS